MEKIKRSDYTGCMLTHPSSEPLRVEETFYV